MLNSVGIQGFKGIKQGFVDNLSQINIITGKNSRGKSAFLQSLYLLNPRRDQSLIPYFDRKELFWQGKTDELIKYEFGIGGKNYHVIFDYGRKQAFYDLEDFIGVEMDQNMSSIYQQKGRFYSPAGHVLNYTDGKIQVSWSIESFSKPKHQLLSSLFDYFGSSVLLNHRNFLAETNQISQQLDNLQNSLQMEDEFLDLLSQAYEVQLAKLRFSPHVFGGWSVFQIDGKESRTISIDMLGDGVRTSLNVLLRLFVQKPKLVLIDEIEAHQHVKALRHTCRAIFTYIQREKASLFVSTHNLEAIKILIELSKEFKIDTMIHHFTLDEGRLSARSIPALDAEVVIDLTGDVRFADEFA